jgi:hypothetical protein
MMMMRNHATDDLYRREACGHISVLPPFKLVLRRY